MGKQTDELREAAERAGVEWRAGLVQGSLDSRVDVGTATELRAGGESLTFEEGEDGLICLDAMSAEQAVAAVVGAGTCNIVRCRDCKRYHERGQLCDLFAIDEWNAQTFAMVKPDGFCAWGERKEVDA